MTDQRAYFKKWYAEHKTELAERRKARYAADPEYRETVLARGQARRGRLREAKAVPEDYIGHQDAAAMLGVSDYVLRYWRTREYYPDPIRLYGRVYFTIEQVHRLVPLRNVLKAYGRSDRIGTSELEDVVNLIYMNWN
jgi:hypothetical protein